MKVEGGQMKGLCGLLSLNPGRRCSGRFILHCMLLPVLSGCGGPNTANIEVRKQNQDLREQVEKLQRQHEADAATIDALEQRSGKWPMLSRQQIEKLYTVHGLRFGRLTGGLDSDPAKPGDEGLRVQIVPTDQDGQDLKAAGSLVVEAFDLAAQAENRIGHWEFDLEAARKSWLGIALAHCYSLECPWQRTPEHPQLTVKVTFHDELTGRDFSVQKVVQVKLASHNGGAADKTAATEKRAD